MQEQDFIETTLSRREIFQGKIIELALDEVRLPSGQTAQRELIFHHGGVGILAITPEDTIILVRQFRKPLERVMLEIPAGKVELGEENHLVTAQRELEEETGYQGQKWSQIFEFATSPGFANEIITLYLSQDLVKVAQPLPQDEDELLEVVFLTLREAQAAIRSGEIADAKTIIAIQYWELNHVRLEEE